MIGRGRNRVAETATLSEHKADRFTALAAESIIVVGRELIEQKKSLGHGNYLAWIDAEFGMHRETASTYMRIANEYGENVGRVRHLSFRALAALAAPSTPPEVRAEVEERASKGEKVTAAAAGNTAPDPLASRRSFQIDRRLTFIGKPYLTQKPKRPWRGFQQREPD